MLEGFVIGMTIYVLIMFSILIHGALQRIADQDRK